MCHKNGTEINNYFLKHHEAVSNEFASAQFCKNISQYNINMQWDQSDQEYQKYKEINAETLSTIKNTLRGKYWSNSFSCVWDNKQFHGKGKILGTLVITQVIEFQFVKDGFNIILGFWKHNLHFFNSKDEQWSVLF